MSKRIEMKGKRFGRLTVESLDHIKRQCFWKCLCDCGNWVIVVGHDLRSGHTSSCGCLFEDTMKRRNGDKNPAWRGGKTINPYGYVLIKYPNHPRTQKGGYVFEHILVAERILGEYIPKKHAIHHINGDKADNRPENLMWFKSRGEHCAFHHLVAENTTIVVENTAVNVRTLE